MKNSYDTKKVIKRLTMANYIETNRLLGQAGRDLIMWDLFKQFSIQRQIICKSTAKLAVEIEKNERNL